MKSDKGGFVYGKNAAKDYTSYYDMDTKNMTQEERDAWKKYWGVEAEELRFRYDGPTSDDELLRRKHRKQTTHAAPTSANKDKIGRQSNESSRSKPRNVVAQPKNSQKVTVPPINAIGAAAAAAAATTIVSGTSTISATKDTASSLRAAQELLRKKTHLSAAPHSARSQLPALKNHTSKTRSMRGLPSSLQGEDNHRRRGTFGGVPSRGCSPTYEAEVLSAAAKSRLEFEQWQRDHAAKHDKKTGRKHSPRTSNLLTSLSTSRVGAEHVQVKANQSNSSDMAIFSPRQSFEPAGFKKARHGNSQEATKRTVPHARTGLQLGLSKTQRQRRRYIR